MGRRSGRRVVAVVGLAAAAVGGCAPRHAPLPWREEEVGGASPPPRRPGDTPAAAEARLRAAGDDPVALVEAAVALGALGGDLAPHRGAVHAAIDELLEPELRRLAALAAPDREPAGALALREALMAQHQGDPGAARAALARFARAPEAGDAGLAARARALAAETVAPSPARVAVLLPLTGRFAALGAELQAAVALAPRDGATLRFLDTGGTESGAEAAVEQAAADGAVLLLGPVGEREGRAAARRAVELGLPIGLLSPGDGADVEAGVFRLVGSPQDEARAAARLAAAEGAPTVAVLAPRDDVGAAMAAAFAAEAAALGLAVTRAGSYDPTASALEEDVKQFLDLVPARNPALAAHLRRHGRRGWQTFSPEVDFAALYVPDAHDRATLVAAYLPYLGVELATTEFPDPEMLARKHGGRIPQVVQLIGSGGWNHPGLAARGGDAVEGALVVDACAGELDPAGAAGEVAARLRQVLGDRAPSSAALQAYDAATLALAARARAAAALASGADAGADPRALVAAALAQARLVDGACPDARVGVDGEVEREAVVLVVDGGELVLAGF